MIGIVGKLLITLAFVSGLGSLFYYFKSASDENEQRLKIGNWFFGFVAHKWTGMRNEV